MNQAAKLPVVAHEHAILSALDLNFHGALAESLRNRHNHFLTGPQGCDEPHRCRLLTGGQGRHYLIAVLFDSVVGSAHHIVDLDAQALNRREFSSVCRACET